MKTKTILGLLVLFVLSGLIGAKAQPVVHPKAYYDAISYQWTDANGVSHTNAITDEATNPYQIVALLKKVYCDPNLPGPWCNAFKQNGEREDTVYYGAVTGGWNISASEVTKPYEEGYTILMVGLNNHITPIGEDTEQQYGTTGLIFPRPVYDTFSSNFFTTTNELIDYISNNVTSVQLLCDGLRVGSGTLSGTTFNISGDFNRFFVLSKGQARQKDSWVIQQENSYSGYDIIAGEYVPFKSMFEQFSPTDGGEGSYINDFYAKMIGGKLYPVAHDCASVIEKQHEFSMSGPTGTEYKSLTGMNIFIPDYRLMYWIDDNFYIHYQNGNTEGPYSVDGRTMNPYKRATGSNFRNPSLLCANYAQYNLDHAPKMGIYLVNLEAEAEPTATEHVYNVILNWTSSLDEMTGETVPQLYTIYLVLTDEDGNEIHQEITVTGNTTYTYEVPQNEHSYTLTYIVFAKPDDGEHDMFVAWSNEASVVIPGWYDFLNLDLKNYESDYVSDVELNYYRNHIGVTNEDAVNALTPDRINNGENDFTLYRYDAADENVLVPVANLYLTTLRGNVKYTINYEPQEALLPDYEPLETVTGDLGFYDAEDAIDLDPIVFVDQFTASTAENDHPARYGYVLKLNNATAEKSTNHVEVPVFKTTSTMEGYYTLEEIMADTDASLTTGVKNANVKMTLSPNPSIYYYTLDRGNNTNPNEAISKLQRRSDGTYREMLDVLPQYYNTDYEPGEVERLDNNVITGYYNEHMSYQPIIWTFRDDNKENSYGSPIWRNYVGDVTGDVNGFHTYTTPTASGEWLDENNQRCYIYNPIITANGVLPEGANVNYEPYMYRVWRLCSDVRGYVRNSNGKLVNDPEADRSPDKLIAEEMTDHTTIEFGDNNMSLAFGATDNTDIKFRVRYYYQQTGPSRAVNEEPKYYVVERILDWYNIPTGICEVNASYEVSKTYYNAQGLSSDKPFDGVNIVVTTYSDGSTYTSKVVR